MSDKKINEIVEEFKSDFSGSNDYMSGVNDASYSMLRKILKFFDKNKSDVTSVLENENVYIFSENEILK